MAVCTCRWLETPGHLVRARTIYAKSYAANVESRRSLRWSFDRHGQESGRKRNDRSLQAREAMPAATFVFAARISAYQEMPVLLHRLAHDAPFQLADNVSFSAGQGLAVPVLDCLALAFKQRNNLKWLQRGG